MVQRSNAVTLSDLPVGASTPLYREVAEPTAHTPREWLCDTSQGEIELARDAGTIVTAWRREPNGRMVLVARPVPLALRRLVRAP